MRIILANGSGAMRLSLMVMLMVLVPVSAVLSGQRPQENWTACRSDDPERSIKACSVVINSGQKKGKNLATAFWGRGSAYAHG
jgi:hypothetical protein